MSLSSGDRTEPGKRADQAYVAIKRKLISGFLTGGTRLDITELGKELRTSRQPVLSAINRLAAEGFLRVVPQVGCWVANVKTDEVVDFFRFFAMTEGLACELGARRRDPSHLAALDANLAAAARLIDSGAGPAHRAREFFRLNREFHGQIHDMARSSYVATHAGSMWDRCDFYLASADPHIQGDRIVESAQEHAAIVAAITGGDAEQAGHLMAAHIQTFGDAAVKRLPRVEIDD